MRNSILYSLAGLVFLLATYACSDNEKYSTSVVRQIEIFLDDEPWMANIGSFKSLYIYNDKGEYLANYSSLYRFQLSNGNYKIVSVALKNMTDATVTMPYPANLNDIVIQQDPEAIKKFAVSAPIEYSSPFNEPLSCRVYSRTGVLRLKSTDKKADKSYSVVRAVVSTPISAYKVANAQYIETPIEVTHDKASTSGGVNYTDDLVLFETETIGKDVTIRIDYLDQNNVVVQSKMLDGSFPVLPDDTTQIAFALNNVDEPIIQDYTVTIASEGWNEEELNPEAPMRIPEGYRYVSPEEDINAIYGQLKNDSEVNDIKLFLKAGATYTLTSKTLNDASKSVYIMGEEPKTGQDATNLIMEGVMSIGNSNVKTVFEAVHFENLKIKTNDHFFNFKNQLFEIDKILFKNCDLELPKDKTMWYQIASGDYTQIVNNFIVENCRFYNIGLYKSAFLGLGNKQILPMYNIVFRNSTLHVTKINRAALINNLNRIPDNLSVTIENCTFVNLNVEGTDMTFFDLDGSGATNFILTVKNNLFSGVLTTTGTWLRLKGVTNRTIVDNYYTKGFALTDWGVEGNEIPVATILTMDELFQNPTEGDLTIKDKNSEVYTKRIGDPHWIR